MGRRAHSPSWVRLPSARRCSHCWCWASLPSSCGRCCWQSSIPNIATSATARVTGWPGCAISAAVSSIPSWWARRPGPCLDWPHSMAGPGTFTGVCGSCSSPPGASWLESSAPVSACLPSSSSTARSPRTRPNAWTCRTRSGAGSSTHWAYTGTSAVACCSGSSGLYVVDAAWRSDPHYSNAVGGALGALAHRQYGAWLLGALAIGLMSFGLFQILKERYRLFHDS